VAVIGISTVNLDPLAINELLNSPDGPVGQVILELSVQATKIAAEAAPLQKPWNHSWVFAKSTSYMPWSTSYLKANVRSSGVRYNALGQLYSGVNAPYGPTLFLEKPADQLHRQYPFLSTALYTVQL
jgi:hypothetical protein